MANGKVPVPTDEIIGWINTYYEYIGVAKTISVDNWAQIIRDCSVEDLEQAARAVFAVYCAYLPSSPRELALEGPDAVANYISANKNSYHIFCAPALAAYRDE